MILASCNIISSNLFPDECLLKCQYVAYQLILQAGVYFYKAKFAFFTGHDHLAPVVDAGHLGVELILLNRTFHMDRSLNQSVTNIFEYPNIRIFLIQIYIRTFVRINILIRIYSDIRSCQFFDMNIFGHSFVSKNYSNIFVKASTLFTKPIYSHFKALKH